uniref:Pseudouridine synthase I TruA alpha/beta domain-containing protein n=1 Tax=Ananas comosus var. bracteatus TaxID=296719 RepID=A0A6V7QQN5_ANACO
MAASEAPTRSAPSRPMPPSNGPDLPPPDSQSLLRSLRMRLDELEKENERLRSRLFNCRCSKEEDAAFHPVAAASLDETIRGAKRCEEIHATKVSEHSQSFSSDHLLNSSIDSVEVKTQTVGLFPGNSSDCGERETSCTSRIINRCSKRYIALKIMYFGQRFYGFASEAQMEPTVESEIFKALERTKLLVGNKDQSHYSRCGRTDKGVSSTGQVISLYLRSNLKDIGGNSTERKNSASEEKCEIDYVRVLNRVLPKDIRVIGWCPVPADFHARFGCLSREYRYFFWKRNLDILKMQEAAAKFIGEHDFRNFCKMDAANVSNYRRKITNFNISSCNERSNDDELWAVTIKGSAFLWHQVRCMIAVLFMVGQGLETPSIVDPLLDTSRTLRKPQYNMAPELPLVLRSCEFENISFTCSLEASKAVTEHLRSEYHNYMLQAAIHNEALGCLCSPDNSSPEPDRKNRGHIPLLLRQTEPSYEERLAKFNAKGIRRRSSVSSSGNV